jgi:hypothetical protein
MGAMRTTVLLGFTALLTAAPAAGQPQQNIFLPEALRPILADALDKSPTLRRQFDQIASAHRVLVYVHLGEPPEDAHVRATSTIRRYTSGLLLATIEIPAATTEPVELLSHEFEHVIEQIEHVDLRALAAADSHAAWRRGDGAFETLRAQRIGATTAAEVLAAIAVVDTPDRKPQKNTEKHK